MMKVNLLEEKNPSIEVNWNEVFITLLVIIFILTLSGHFYVLYRQKTILQNQVNTLNNKIDYFQPRVNRHHELTNKIEKLKKIENITWQRFMLSNALDDLSYTVPQKLTLESILIEDGLINMSGFARDNENIVTFVNNLKLSPYFKNVSLNQLKSGKDITFKLETNIISKGGK